MYAILIKIVIQDWHSLIRCGSVITIFRFVQGLVETASIQSVAQLEDFKGTIECDVPNRHLYEFKGNIAIGNER